MNTATYTMSAKNKAKWEKIGAVVTIPTNPKLAHLQKHFDARAEEMAKFDMYEVTLDMSKVPADHPLHAMV